MPNQLIDSLDIGDYNPISANFLNVVDIKKVAKCNNPCNHEYIEFIAMNAAKLIHRHSMQNSFKQNGIQFMFNLEIDNCKAFANCESDNENWEK